MVDQSAESRAETRAVLRDRKKVGPRAALRVYSKADQ